MSEFRNKHSRNAIEGGAAFLLYRFKCRLRLKTLRGIDHRRAMSDAAQIAHNHTKTVVKWHRDTDLILSGDVLKFRDKIAIVEDVMMTECRPFRETGSSARVLNVDSVVKLLFTLDSGKFFFVYMFAQCHQIFPAKHTSNF